MVAYNLTHIMVEGSDCSWGLAVITRFMDPFSIYMGQETITIASSPPVLIGRNIPMIFKIYTQK